MTMTEEEIEGLLELLKGDHSYANNNCPRPFVVSQIKEMKALCLRGLRTEDLEAQVKALKEGLMPFAKAATYISDKMPDEGHGNNSIHFGAVGISVGNLRRAAELVKGE